MNQRVQSLAGASSAPEASLGQLSTPSAPAGHIWNQLLVVRANVSGNIALCLIDSGATHNFVASRFVAEFNLPSRRLSKPMTIVLADGDSQKLADHEVSNVTLCIDSFSTQIDLVVADLSRYDVILGKPWLWSADPQISFRRNELKLFDGSSYIITQGISSNIDKPVAHVSAPLPEPLLCVLPQPHSPKGLKFDNNFIISGKQARKLLRQGSQGFLAVVSCLDGGRCCINSVESVKSVGVTGDRYTELAKILDGHKDCFPVKPPVSLPPRREIEHEIVLQPGEPPPSSPAIRLSRPHMDELQRQIEDLLHRKVIEPSKSPYGAPVFFVKKADGSLRLVCDWRQLNRITIKNKACLPNIEDLFDTVLGTQYFSKLDLMSGYHQVRVKESDIPKTAVNTPLGHFQFRVMGFGLTNAPATFMSLMTHVLRPYLRKFVVVFLDDILIFSKSWKEHLQHIDIVLGTLKKEGLYCKPSKCEFAKTQISYLGHVLTGHTIAPDPDKISTVADWPRPTSISEVRQFLGFSNYFRRFIASYSNISRPLEEISGKHSKFLWSTEREAAFRRLKSCLLNAPVLHIADCTKPLRVSTDASDFALGGVLEQETVPGSWHPIAFTSRRLTAAEKNYTALERETLAVVHALRTWRIYLHMHFELYTDNRGLTFWQSKKHMSRREARWLEFLAEFDFSLKHRPGNQNVADPVSRRPDLQLSPITLTVQEDAEFSKLLSQGYAKDKQFQSVIQRLLSNQRGAFHDKYTWVSDTGRLYLTEPDCWRLCIPVGPLRIKLLQAHHDCPTAGHPGRDRTYARVARNYYWPGIGRDVKLFVQSCDSCQRFKSNRAKAGLLQPLPVPARPWDDIGMDFVVGLPVSSQGYDAILTFVDRLSKCVHFVPTSSSVSAKETASLYVSNVFRLHGLSKSIVCDRDPRFAAEFFREVCHHLGVDLKMSTANHPQTDGCTERVHRVLGDVLRCFVNHHQDNWVQVLPLCEYAINATPSESTKESPFFLNFGQHPNSPCDFLFPLSNPPDSICWVKSQTDAINIARDCLTAAQVRQSIYADQKRYDVDFQEGDEVLVHRDFLITSTARDQPCSKLRPKWFGPFPIVKKLSSTAYKLKLPSDSRAHPVFNVSALKPYVANSFPDRAQPKPPPITDMDGNTRYMVDEILREKQRGRQTFYLVKWTGYDEPTWEPQSYLQDEDGRDIKQLKAFKKLAKKSAGRV